MWLKPRVGESIVRAGSVQTEVGLGRVWRKTNGGEEPVPLWN
jgi:hypothetical protein